MNLEIRGPVLARNALINLLGQGIPLLIGIVAIPFVVRGLEPARFGILSLAWVFLGLSGWFFNFGLARATTRFVAQALGKGEEEQVPRLVWTAVTVQAVLGLVAALIFIGIVPLLVESILNIPAELRGEAKATLYVLALVMPVVLVSNCLSGVLEAAQRFDLVNVVRIPSNASVFLMPLIGLNLGLGLVGMVGLIAISRCVAACALLALSLRVMPKIKKFSVSFSHVRPFFTYSSWVTVTNVVGPVLMYLERFLITLLLSTTALGYYTAPYEAVIRLWVIPVSLFMIMLPAFSYLEAIEDRQRVGTLFARSVKYVLVVLGPVVLILVLFADDILRIWLGGDFASQSKVVMQILAVGVLVSGLAYIPYALLNGIGRPDITAKFHLLELPLHIGVTWFLVSRWGIAGAATAWTIRAALDALLLFVGAFKVYRLSPGLLATNGVTLSTLALAALVGIAYGLKKLTAALPLSVESMLFILLFALVLWFIWRKVLEASERQVILNILTKPKEAERAVRNPLADID